MLREIASGVQQLKILEAYPAVAAGMADWWIAQYNDVDNKMLMCLGDVDTTVTCASGF